MTWKWRWSTDCPAAGPFACAMLIPGGSRVRRTASATRRQADATAARDSSSASKRFGTCVFGMTRQWPSFAGLMSMNERTRSFSRSLNDGISPATMRQKMQSGSAFIPGPPSVADLTPR